MWHYRHIRGRLGDTVCYAMLGTLLPTSESGVRRVHVTILFSDLCDYTRLSEACDPEEVAEMLQRTKRVAQQVIDKHGGTLNQFYGDGLLSVFGLPTPTEDDARHAAEAALELHREVAALYCAGNLPESFRLRLHSGIHSGLVVARESDPRNGRFELFGDPVTTAARLSGEASADEILVSEAALRGILRLFRVEAVAPLILKGKGNPLGAYRLLERKQAVAQLDHRSRAEDTPLVGRDEELAKLLRWFDESSRSRWRTAHILAEGGLGKSRLLREFQLRATRRGARALIGCCEKYAVAPFEPVLQWLRQVFGLEPEMSQREAIDRIERWSSSNEAQLSAEHRRALLQVLNLASPAGDVDEKALQTAIVEAVLTVLLRVAYRQPLALMIDDWQWVDDASMHVVLALLEQIRIRAAPVFLLVASLPLRPGQPRLHEGELMELRQLDADAARTTIRALLPDSLELGVIERVLEQSGGNPQFLEELCHSLRSRTGRAEESIEVPTSLHCLIQARVGRLGPELTEVCSRAAVIGNQFEAWLLRRMLGDRDVSSSLEELGRLGLVLEGPSPGVYRFKQGITRDVVYASIPLAERRRMHGRAARLIEARLGVQSVAEHCESLAYHFAGAGIPERAAYYAELAGNKAAARSALDRARQQYGSALKQLDRLPFSNELRQRWLELSRRWAGACVFCPSPEQLQTLMRARDYAIELGDEHAVAQTYYWLGWIHYALGNQHQALEETQKALEIALHLKRSRLTAQLYANLGQAQTAAAMPARALSSLGQSLRMWEGDSSRTDQGVHMGYVYALGCQGLAHGFCGRFFEAYQCLDSALGRVSGAEHAIEASLLGLLAMVLSWQGRWEDCLHASLRMRATAKRVRGAYVYAMSQVLSSYARSKLSPGDGVEELQRAVEWLKIRGMRLFASYSFGCLADALIVMDQTEAARAYAEQALRCAKRLDCTGITPAQLVLARCSAQEGSEVGVQHHLHLAHEAARQSGSRREEALVRWSSAELPSSRNTDAAKALARQARDAFEAMGMHWYQTQL